MNPFITIAIIALAGIGGFSAGAVTGYERGSHARDTHWQGSIAKANAAHEEALKVEKDKVRQADELAKGVAASLAKINQEKDDAITAAQSKIPLSDACKVCAIPAARIHGGVRN